VGNSRTHFIILLAIISVVIYLIQIHNPQQTFDAIRTCVTLIRMISIEKGQRVVRYYNWDIILSGTYLYWRGL